MRTTLNNLLIVIFLLLTFINCSDDNPIDGNGNGNGNGDNGTKAVSIKINYLPTTYSQGGAQKDPRSVKFTSGHLYFTNSSGSILKYYTISESSSDANNIQLSELTRSSGKTIKDLPNEVSTAYVVGNSSDLPIEGNISSVQEHPLVIKSQSDISNFNLYGSGSIVSNEVTVVLAPTLSRFELTDIVAKGHIESFEVAGVFIDHYYSKATVSGNLNSSNLVFNGEDASKFSKGTSAYPSDLHSSLYDWYDTPLQSDSKVAKLSDGDVWNYHLFAQSSEVPNIVIRLTNIVTSPDSDVSFSEDQFLTISGFKDGETLLSQIDADKVYNIGAGALLFDESDLSPKPNTKGVDVDVTVSTMTSIHINLQALSSLERLTKPLFIEIQGKKSAEIYAGRNETESFQVVINSEGGPLEDVHIEMSELKSENNDIIDSDNIQLFREYSVTIYRPTTLGGGALGRGLYPDALVPFIDPYTSKPTSGGMFPPQGFSILQDEPQAIWIDVYVPKGTNPGVYRGKINVSASNSQPASINVELTVWNFTLPDVPSHESVFGDFYSLYQYYDISRTSERMKLLEDRYTELFGAHRLSPQLPRNKRPSTNSDGSIIVDARFDRDFTEFITKNGVSTFRFPATRLYTDPLVTGRERMINLYRSYYQYLKDKGWEDKALLYMVDEPEKSEQYQSVLDVAELAKEAVPELRRLVTTPTYAHDRFPEVGSIKDAVNLWVPLFGQIHESGIQEALQRGDEVWSYTALVQKPRSNPDYNVVEGHPPYWQIDFPLTNYRVSTWVNKRYNITGLLYWATIHWASKKQNPWRDTEYLHSQGYVYNGEGNLIYPGDDVGIEGPVASIRLKALRDAMQDYDYFVLLEKIGRGDLVEQIINEVIPNWGDWDRNHEVYLEKRKIMGEVISAASPN